MSRIHFYINKEDDILAVSFDNEVAFAFRLSYRDFADNPTYEAAHAWFSSKVSSRYYPQSLSTLGHLIEL